VNRLDRDRAGGVVGGDAGVVGVSGAAEIGTRTMIGFV